MLASLDRVLIDDYSIRWRKCCKGTISLVLKTIPISKKKDMIIFKNIAANELPNELKNCKGLACACRHQQEHSALIMSKPTKGFKDRHLLIGPDLLLGNQIHIPRCFKHWSPALPIDFAP